MSAFHSKRARARAIILAILALMCLFTFVLNSLSPSIALRRSDNAATDQIAVALETVKDSRVAAAAAASRHKQPPNKWRTQLKLTPAQELAAISSFLESLPQNVIPSSVDPTRPIDPQLVLDFDTGSSRAAAEVEAMVYDVWSRNPVMLYSKVCSPVYLRRIYVYSTAFLLWHRSSTPRRLVKSRQFFRTCIFIHHPRSWTSIFVTTSTSWLPYYLV